MREPLVSVICLCYNHERYVAEALHAVLEQTYRNIEIIVVDDASTDNSVARIQETIAPHAGIQFIALKKNIGNCTAFNRGLALAKGDYIVDLSADDVLMPERIADQVNHFRALDPSYGVVFTDAVYINEQGQPLRQHFAYLFSKKLLHHIPEGDIYSDVLSTYFIASPTMLVKREVFDLLQGYDESLAYEDFDFWVRSSRYFKYSYLDKPLTRIRRLDNSLSTRSYIPGDLQLYSTYLVCKKAMALNRGKKDHAALVKRARYELFQSVFSQNITEANLFYDLLCQLEKPRIGDNLLIKLNKLRLPLSHIRQTYLKLRFG